MKAEKLQLKNEQILTLLQGGTIKFESNQLFNCLIIEPEDAGVFIPIDQYRSLRQLLRITVEPSMSKDAQYLSDFYKLND